MALGWQGRASPVTRVRFRGQRVHVKRDDVFHLAGNKMRKLYWFLQQDDAFFQDAHLVSFGGTQSNAMLAIAQLAHARRVPFTYLSRAFDVKQPPGDVEDNLSLARALGMRHVELPTDEYHLLAATKDLETVAARYLSSDRPRKPLYIPQGAAFAHAEDGLRVLAFELNVYCASFKGEEDDDDGTQEFAVIVPCGTGTTAFYLAQHVDPALTVLAVPCVGDSDYLRQQFDALAALHAPRTLTRPPILVPSTKARFGRPAQPLLDVYHELLDATRIEFDLLYAAFTWQTLFEPPHLATALHAARGRRPRELLYLHTGGVSGNGSMLARYRRHQLS